MRIAAVLVPILFLLPDASAYAPPAGFVLGRVLKDRKGLKSLEWTARVTDPRTSTTFKEMLRVDFGSGRFIATYSTVSDEPLGSHSGDLAGLSRSGRFWLGVGLDPSATRFKAALSALGVLPEEGQESKLLRIGQQPAWGWGESPRVLFTKDDCRPLAYVAEGSPEESIRFDAFSLSGNALQVPKSVRILKGPVEQFRFELRSVKTEVQGKSVLTDHPIENPAVREWVSLVR